jgi:hypothetical protein
VIKLAVLAPVERVVDPHPPTVYAAKRGDADAHDPAGDVVDD